MAGGFNPEDFRDDACLFSFSDQWCGTHNCNCKEVEHKTCPGCGLRFRYAHLNCSAIQPVVLGPGDHQQVTYELTMTTDTGHTVFRTGPGNQYGVTVASGALGGGGVVVHDTFQAANSMIIWTQSAPKSGKDGWYTTQTVVPNTASAEQRVELLRALREDPSMGQRNTRHFVASMDKKRVTTAAAFDNALDIGLWGMLVLTQRQDSAMGGPGATCDLLTLPDDEWVHVIIKPTRPNDLGILALRRNGLLLQVHEVTSGARASSEFPGVDRVFAMITPQ